MTDSFRRDDLTGLYTRGILSALDKEFSGSAGALAIIDIDHFKLVNDVFGHLEGDRVIRMVANILSRNKRSTDTLVRYGGDEFVIVMPDTIQLKAVNHGERILQSLEREVFPEGMEIGLSIGVAESKPDDQHLADILVRADKALYQAKKSGRGRVSFHREKAESSSGSSISFEHFVGRDYELAGLRNTLNRVVEGNGSFVVISGEPGIGKTRLANELKHYSSFKDCLSLEARCDELGTAGPYILITDPVAEYLAALPDSEITNLRNSLPGIMPQTAQFFHGLNLETVPVPDTDKDSVLRLKMYSEIALVLKWIASRHPVIFLVDNLHWISEHDFDLLSYLARATASSRVLFLATMRAPTHSFPEIENKLQILSDTVQYKSIRLENLDEEYTKHMVMFALRDPKIPRGILQRLVKQCSGNPLYLKELLVSLHSSGAIEPLPAGGWAYQFADDVPLPASVSALMSDRLSKLNSFEIQVLSAGSMMPGGNFTLEPLCAVLHKNELELTQALEEPLEMGLVLEHISDSGVFEYRFIHDTMRTFLYQSVSPGVRKTLQLRFGQYYEKAYKNGSPAALPLVAHHYCDSLNTASARHFALLAAKQAKRSGAVQESFHWLKQYLLFASIPDEDKAEAFKARFDIGSLYNMFGNYDAALKILEEAEGLAHTDTQVGGVRFQLAFMHSKRGEYKASFKLYNSVIDLLPEGKERIQSHLQMAYFQNLQSTSAGSSDLLKKILPEILAIEKENLRKELLANYYTTLVLVSLDTRPQAKNTEDCLKAVSLYRELSDRVEEAKALLNTAVTLRLTTRYEQRINILNEALKVLVEVGDAHSTLMAYINLGETYYSAMQYSVARDYFERSFPLIEATGFKSAAVWVNYYLGILEKEENNLQKACEYLETSISLAEELELDYMALTTRIDYVGILIERENYRQADIDLTRLENHSEIDTVGDVKRRLLLGLRGTERMKNPTIEKTKALKQAEEKLKAATTGTEDEPSLQKVQFLASLVECLYQQNKTSESRSVFAETQQTFNQVLGAIENSHHRETVLKSNIPETLDNLKKLISL